MTKKELIKQLKKFDDIKDKIVICGVSSLVLQDVVLDVDVINISADQDIFKSLSCQVKDCLNIEFTDNVNDRNRIIKVGGYWVTDLDYTYEFLNSLGNKKYKKIMEQLEYMLCENNNFYWYEKNLHKKNITYIAGVDEVGRGPLVGPVVAACVVLPEEFSLDGLTDSKKLTEKMRNYFYEEIKKQALGIGIGIIDEKKIDELNIYEATKLAMYKAISECQRNCKIQHVLIDAMPLDVNIPTTSIIKGDIKSITISAASVIAKVTRDRMMYELDEKYPMYDFKNNKGYPTKKRLEALSEYGVLKEHRKTFGPVKKEIEKLNEVK